MRICHMVKHNPKHNRRVLLTMLAQHNRAKVKHNSPMPTSHQLKEERWSILLDCKLSWTFPLLAGLDISVAGYCPEDGVLTHSIMKGTHLHVGNISEPMYSIVIQIYICSFE